VKIIVVESRDQISYAKKPTGIRVIDDLVMHIIAQRDSAMSGVILIGAVAYASRYLEEYI